MTSGRGGKGTTVFTSTSSVGDGGRLADGGWLVALRSAMVAANGGLLEKRGNGRFVQLLSVGGRMRSREGGRGKGGREGRAEICGDYSASTSPEPRAQSPPPPSGPAKRAGTRRLVAVSATKNGAILDHGGGVGVWVWTVAREGGVGSLVVPMANKQPGRAGLAWKPPKVRPKFEQEQRTSGKQKEGDRILAPWQLAARNKRTLESTVRLLEPHPDAGSMRPKGQRGKDPDVESAQAGRVARGSVSKSAMHLTPEPGGGKAQRSSWLATRAPPPNARGCC
ncbi:hypothetical protein B0T18DRAFT_13107 [Schizothecium vesticola]|uniref:Uncharacterized protein n=1 Tax=Schizothecium vesticola TaxID=314040 RepID=A0AA40F960_9PEZI|nr:hypothetical protein B0T18DRAFT_13107 [Schizothecium vesticola]